MSTVISVENVSKAYRLGAIGGGTLREDVSRWWARMRGKGDPTLRIGEEHRQRNIGETFWALRNVSFEVKDGEILGIIGRNGAGKSTLLKILSRVTGPTEGRIRVKGRIASLLEVGTGFHPELTGRENVFLNGAILGMTKAEIRSKFDEIVAFAELDQFIDTPVKRYSSGMYVRLAFAVAAHLEPEILIVDEVLAVGDAAFQKKCLGKMQDVAKGGRTVVFVSHQLGTISSLCTCCLYFRDGQVRYDGPTQDALARYTSDVGDSASTAPDQRTDRVGAGNCRVEGIQIGGNRKGASHDSFLTNDTISFAISLRSTRAVRAWVGMTVSTSSGMQVMHTSNRILGHDPVNVNGNAVVDFVCDRVPLAEGAFLVDVAVYDADLLLLEDQLHAAASFHVQSTDVYGSGYSIVSSYGPSVWDIRLRDTPKR